MSENHKQKRLRLYGLVLESRESGDLQVLLLEAPSDEAAEIQSANVCVQYSQDLINAGEQGLEVTDLYQISPALFDPNHSFLMYTN